MAIRTEIFKVSDTKHTCAGLRESDDPLASMFTECYRCKQDAVAVEVEGERYANYPGGRIETRQSLYLNSKGERYTQVFSIHHEGLVIASRERNYHDDSDFYALVWNPETKRVEEHGVGTTRMGGTDDNYAAADLADEYKADYRQYLIDEQEKALRLYDRQEWQRAAYEAVTPGRKGQTVRVVKGRKVPVGFEGVIIWAGESGPSWRSSTRIGIKSADGDVQFTAASNCVVVADPDDLPYLADFVKSDEEYVKTATGLVDWQGARGLIARNAPAGIHAVA